MLSPNYTLTSSQKKKLWLVTLSSLTTLNGVMGSSLPSDDSHLSERFHEARGYQLVLPNSIYLVGYIISPIIFAPLSEIYGRRFVLIGTFLVYTVFTIAVPLAPNWPAFIIFRLLAGIFGSTPIYVVSGLCADIFGNPIHRGRAVAWTLVVATFGPSMGAAAAGYLAEHSWRWPFWFGAILAGACVLPMLSLPETFGPAILAARARAVRKQEPGSNTYAAIELKHPNVCLIFTAVLGRPLRMMTTEPIVTACCLYLSLIYAVFYMLLQAFEFIYEPVYGFSQGQAGFTFLGTAIGCLLSFPFYLVWEFIHLRALRKGTPWATKPKFRRLPLACLGGPLFTAGLFWLGWAARRDVHWIVPVLSGLPIAVGFVLIFIALSNYLVDAYQIYAASALGATSMARSVFGVALPFAAVPMFRNLGVAWSCSVLGFLSLLMCLIPFVFIIYRKKLREKSPMRQRLARQAETKAMQDTPKTSEKTPASADTLA